ncbi:protein unc-93 homolog A-like [Ciona intestinalis]
MSLTQKPEKNEYSEYETVASDEQTAKTRTSSTSTDSVSLSDLDEIMTSPDRIAAEKRKIMKNLLLICFAFLCNFTAFGGASNLQSSLNPDGGLGTGSLSIIYGSLIISAMFAPTFVIKHLGCKWTICFAIIGYMTYSLANFYPHWGTLVPSSIIVGLSGAPLWSAKCAYLTTSAKRYARLTNESTDSVVNRFFGIFFLFFQFNNIIGNLISSFILSSEDGASLAFPTCYNASFIENYCGHNDCQDDIDAAKNMYNSSECPVLGVSSSDVSNDTLYLLMGIYAAVALLGALVVGFLVDPIKIREKEDRGVFDLLIATFKHMQDRRQFLLIPITMYSGFEQAFITGDYTRSFITCPLAVNWVGFVLICYGACDSLCSFCVGYIEKYTGRPSLFGMAAVIHLALIITFLIWIPYPTSQALFFVLPAFWGVGDAVWQTQLNAFYGVLFVGNQEASFANYRLWESLGFVIAFAYQTFICVEYKLYVLLSVLVVGMSLYSYVEFTERRNRSRASNDVEKHTEENEAYLQSQSSFGGKNSLVTQM